MPNDRRLADRGGARRAARPARVPPRWPKAMAVALGITLAGGPIHWVAAQSREARITVAPTILAEPASQASLLIQVGPPDALPSNSFVRLRGLPATVSLTEGYAIAPGSWAVPLFGLPSLKAVVPAGISGRTEIIINLVDVDGTTLAETRTALIVAPATVIAPVDRVPAEPPQRRAATPRFVPPRAAVELGAEEKQRTERLVAQGDRHLEQGNIGAARMFFQRAAEAGLAHGAVKMAATYDPIELERLRVKVQGVAADRAEARRWYERARELGSPEADERLARMGGS